MRNWGGFHLPPTIPSTKAEIHRAIQLLGNNTTRKLSQSKLSELELLVGAIPRGKEESQQWKVTLTKRVLRELEDQELILQGKADQVERAIMSRSHRSRDNKLLDVVTLPETREACSYVFSMLDVMSRNALRIKEEDKQRMNELIHFVPKSRYELELCKNALGKLQLKRARREKKPPKVPESDEEVMMARMLLGIYVKWESVGKKNPDLEELVGQLPRNANVAKAWKKKLRLELKKRTKTRWKEYRQLEIEDKRHARREKKERLAAMEAAKESNAVETPDPPVHVEDF